MSSNSSAGASVITLQFALVVDMGVAEQEVQAAINTASSLLPSDLPTPPVYRKVNPADAPILTLAVSSDTLPLPAVYDLVDTRMAQKLAQLTGCGYGQPGWWSASCHSRQSQSGCFGQSGFKCRKPAQCYQRSQYQSA